MLRSTLILTLSVAAILARPASAADGAADGVVYRLSSDGDWLAAVRPADAERQGPELILAPIEPQLQSSAFGRSAGTRLSITGPVGLTASVGTEGHWVLAPASTALSPPAYCDGIAGLMSVSGLNNDCLGASVSGPDRMPRLQRNQAEVAWNSTGFGIALSYGASSADQISLFSGPLLGLDLGMAPGIAPPLPYRLPGAAFDGSGRDVSLSGTWRLAPASAINLGATLGEWSLRPQASGIPINLDQASVRLGITHGAFSGAITGRVMRPNGINAGAQWGGLDLGVSWRTPWQGELSFGAQNLISRGSDGLQPSPDNVQVDEASTRTPYVRYKQDL